MTKTIDILALAAAHIEHGWTQGRYANDDTGSQTTSNAPEAVSWCLIGAISAALQNRPIGSSLVIGLIFEACARNGLTTPTSFNDSIATCPEDVLALISDAVDLADD